jgi:poly-gamma-glutamate synthesis protein (capsule biosynthesis protein)
MKAKIAFLRLVLRILALFKGRTWRTSPGHEDNSRYMDLGEKLFWAYKAMIRQVEEAEAGSGLEESFAGQDLDFSPPPGFEPEASFLLSAGGDLSAMDLIRPENTERLWDEVSAFLFGAPGERGEGEKPFAIANLEAPLVPDRPAVGVPAVCLGAPMLNGSVGMFERFQSGGGFGLLATANNHSLDQGPEGVAATLDFLDGRGIPHVGTARSPAERDAFPIVERNGVKVAFLSWTYCLNDHELPEGGGHLVNVMRFNKEGFDIGPFRAQVAAARARGADFVVALPHWSVEFECYPTLAVAEAGRRMAEAGADLVLGGHPHNAQPSERLKVRDPDSGREKDVLIVYSLGELVALNLNTRNSRLAQLVRVELSVGREGGRKAARITGFEVLPILTSYRKMGAKDEYRIFDLRALLGRLDGAGSTGSIAGGAGAEALSAREAAEVRRLGRLCEARMLPRRAAPILAPAGAWGRPAAADRL